MKRRDFLIQSSLFSASTIAAVGSNAWVARSATNKTNQQRLIVIFLRGGVDGLNVVVPYSETAYYKARPKIAIPKPDKNNGVLKLDNRFGLHPALAPLMPLWQQKNLAFIHACGSPDPTRSHFEAQHYMEIGIPGNQRIDEGWMNRLIGVKSHNSSPLQALSIGGTKPRILSGQMPVSNIPSGNNANQRLAIDRAHVGKAFDQLYSSNDALSENYRHGQQARQAIMNGLDAEAEMANNGAPLPNNFIGDVQRLGNLMVKDPRIELGFAAVGGWDTHVNQGNYQGSLANSLARLGKGLAALTKTLGPVYQNTLILVMSEFGRTARENSTGGTDHGHGNVMWVLGGKVHGGKVYGEWPGLATEQLYQKRDLAITTDFRDVISTVLAKHLHLNDKQLNQVLPSYVPKHQFPLI